jgi:hypothetical protein
MEVGTLPLVRLSLLLCLLFPLVSQAWAAAALPDSRALDGLQFEGETGETGKGTHHEDTIRFEHGRFRSLDCENWGFGPAPYSVEKDEDGYRFSAVLRSANRGTLEWKGTIRGDAAQATFRWLHERWYWTKDRWYWFKGTRTVSN